MAKEMASGAPPGGAAQPLFTGLDESERRALAARAAVQSYPKGAVILSEGDAPGSIFIVRTGRVKVFLRGRGGREVVLNVHGPGDYFGEISLDEGPRSASVMTLEPSQFLVISREEFSRFLAENPAFALKLVRRLMSRVRALTESVRNLALLDVYGRIARLLLDLSEEREGRLVVAEPLTQKAIAERVGCSREMVSRVFKDLLAGGYVAVQNRRITILRDLPRRR
ncbi:MAG TPA: Crp/Fnr family transcriptional regulator [Burkholderiales bacterium]|nr:Crp/Fnr family transcriptional regulator [Burkholderiales bacterium]